MNSRAPGAQRFPQLLRCKTGPFHALLAAATASSVSGCATRGAPSFVLFGAFFPDWMLLAGIGILAAIGTRLVLLSTGLAEVIPLQLLVCVSVGLTVAILTWRLWFGI